MKQLTTRQKLERIYRIAYKKKKLNSNGLCNSLGIKLGHNLHLFEPSDSDYMELIRNNLSAVYWGSGLGMFLGGDDCFEFTDLRQTILGFLIAMEK